LICEISRIYFKTSINVPSIILTLLWFALADQSDLAGYQANAVDKRARRSEDDQSNPTGYQADIVQVTRVVHFFFYVCQCLNHLCYNSIILSCISNLNGKNRYGGNQGALQQKNYSYTTNICSILFIIYKFMNDIKSEEMHNVIERDIESISEC